MMLRIVLVLLWSIAYGFVLSPLHKGTFVSLSVSSDKETEILGDVFGSLYGEDDDDDDDDEEIESPFDPNRIEESVNTIEDNLEFTMENVDKVLEEVRPYLISDGGNVALKEIDVNTRNVYLSMVGACGSCSASA